MPATTAMTHVMVATPPSLTDTRPLIILSKHQK